MNKRILGIRLQLAVSLVFQILAIYVDQIFLMVSIIGVVSVMLEVSR